MKLVRDFIPHIIERDGRTCTYHVAGEEEYEQRLFDKMREELDEFVEEPSIEEAGDMYEVFVSILELHDIDLADVKAAALEKKALRGGFDSRIVLEAVDA